MTTEKEKIYDDQIYPLMDEIIRICREHRIAFIFDVALGYASEEDAAAGAQLKCTSCLLEDDCEPDAEMLRAMKCIQPRQSFGAFTITTVDN